MSWTVVGVGSRVARDDAVGIKLVEDLRTLLGDTLVDCLLWEDVDALTLAQNLLDLGKPVVVVDAANMGLPAGSWRLVRDDEVCLQPNFGTVSTHGIGLGEALALARDLGYAHSIHLFLVQPFDLSPRMGLTPEMEAVYPALLGGLHQGLATLSLH